MAVVASAGLVASTAALAKPRDELDQRIAEELRNKDAAMADIFEQANMARERADHRTAEMLYEQVFVNVPTFVHAERRRCGELLELGRRGEALTACRDAVSKEESALNMAALASALLRRIPGAEPNDNETDEAVRLLDRAQGLEPDNAQVAMTQCQAAVQRKNLGELRDCSTRLQRIAPNEPVAAYSSWLVAMEDGRFDDAEGYVEQARRNGMEASAVAHLAEETRSNRPWTDRAWYWGMRLIGAWLGIGLVLVLLGSVLSRTTLRTAENWQPDSARRGASLRSLYRGVLVVCSLLYYVSLPLVFLLVIAPGAGLVWGMFAIGYVPIKLGLVAIVMVFATGAALLKSLTFRPTEEAPGIEIDLSTEPELRRVLDEVAATIGTRSVDKVYLAPNTNLAVFERKRGERCLVVGAGVLHGMPLDAFKAILAHEYGHFSNRDTAGGGFALGVRRSLLGFIVGLAQSGQNRPWNPAWWFATSFYKLFLRVSQGASRLQEILADRRAAEAYGGAAFATGLKHVIACDLRFGDHVNAEINRALKNKVHLQNLWTPLPLDTLEPGEIAKALEREPSPYDSHPAPSDRIRWVEQLAATVPSTDAPDKDAWSLFQRREHHEREVTLFVYQRLAKSGVHPQALPKVEASYEPR